MPNLTIVIVTANTCATTLACIDTLPAGEYEIIVIDNGSEDDTVADIRRNRPDVRLVALGEPVGFAAGCNRGAELATGELVLFLNSDIAANPGAIDRLVGVLSRHPDAVAAGGRLVDPGSDNTQVAYRPRTFPTALTLVVQFLGLARLWPGNPVTRRHLGGHLPANTVSEVEQPAGACMVVKRHALEQIRGLDEGYWFWFEDVDLCRRLHALGPILYVPAASFEHRGAASFKQWTQAQIVRSRHHGLVRYVRTHLALWQRLVVAVVLAPVLVARGLVADRATQLAYREALTALPRLALPLPSQSEVR